MDCPSEVKLIEGVFENLNPLIKIEFDLDKRVVTFYHNIEEDLILRSLRGISLPGEIINSEEIKDGDVPEVSLSVEAKTLKYLLTINFTMFVAEVIVGIYAESTGLLADGLDMLADSLVYGISLYAVGKTIIIKNKAARLSGLMQISLGILCLFEVGRKLYFGSEPISSYIVAASTIALIANIWSLALIHKHKDGEIHMKASWIFSANDVIVNTGVITSGVLVYLLKSNIPDLIIGAGVSLFVIKGGITIIKLSRLELLTKSKGNSCCSAKFNEKI